MSGKATSSTPAFALRQWKVESFPVSPDIFVTEALSRALDMDQEFLFLCVLFITFFSLEKYLVTSDILPVNLMSFDEELIGASEKDVLLLEHGSAAGEKRLRSQFRVGGEIEVRNELLAALYFR